ncbi:MAG: RsmE family RNA methyltransferase [Sandaracinaceae bacterium]
MTVRRLPVPRLPGLGTATLPPGAEHHARVLRLSAGEPVVLFDGSGREAEAVIRSADGDRVECEVTALRQRRERGPSVTLLQALPKGDKLEAIVRMATELGVRAIHLVRAARSVARPDPARADRRAARLARVAEEAARQSGRATVPPVHPAASLEQVLDRAPGEVRRLAFVPDAEAGLEAVLRGGGDAWVLIGPEGGFGPEERALLQRRGWVEVSLGPGVLRVETAAPVALALVLHRLGGLRPATPAVGGDGDGPAS